MHTARNIYAGPNLTCRHMKLVGKKKQKLLPTWISLTLSLTTPEFLSALIISFSVKSPAVSILPGNKYKIYDYR